MKSIKKVHVIYKTHLDVGFTDLAANVVDRYIQCFIPKAVELAYKVNRAGEGKKFVWTMGSWLIDEYLRRTDGKDREKLINAIKEGYISWHGLPFTTHSELMDEELFDFGISISKDLDRRFNRNTIAAKMTDVPGHTRGIIGPLSKNGIKYLHIGVNNASRKPNVYDTFIWKDSAGNEIIVDYCQGYGRTAIAPGLDEVLVFAHSLDNLGPPSEEEVYRHMDQIEEQYPDAEVCASTLDCYAEALMKVRDNLPVITEEIGDTWIHGTASDPYKVSCFLELSRMRDKWTSVGKLEKGSEAYREFSRCLLMIPEHTWGLDFKKYLTDYKNWKKQDFIQARMLDKVKNDYIPEKYKLYGNYARKEFESVITSIGWDERSYSYYESSHEEQRGYIYSATEALEPELKKEAIKAIKALKMSPHRDKEYREININEEYSLNGYIVKVLANGSILLKAHKLKSPAILGKMDYELLGSTTFRRWKKEYMVDMEENEPWAMQDFFKPGIEEAGVPGENTHFNCRVKGCYHKGNEIMIEAEFCELECNEYGCPRNVVIKYVFNEDYIEMSAFLSKKDASRMPEALWISHFLENGGVQYIKIKKMGETIDPFKVVEQGNRNYHLVKEVNMTLEGMHINILPLDSPLLSIGEKRLYDFNQNYADIKRGLNFNLYNNLWGTNFKMWYEEDIISRFIITIK